LSALASAAVVGLVVVAVRAAFVESRTAEVTE
jgi:hypothetical protein